MGDRVPPVGDQVSTGLFIVEAELALGVTNTADWNDRDKFTAESRVKITPLLRRGPTSVAGEAAAGGAGGLTGEASRLDAVYQGREKAKQRWKMHGKIEDSVDDW